MDHEERRKNIQINVDELFRVAPVCPQIVDMLAETHWIESNGVYWLKPLMYKYEQQRILEYARPPRNAYLPHDP
ncbi:hypothetical protein F4561_005409 [Lipingzhangella halophila]|uniref:Uncharacterized protein n=1 Tax=Lipingzhangella halophila TaxID=1783352 RepID=A0A7W7W666_9ACTN|nr:hypothetical protein [Lipingzhangella halophila]MBB4934589.1 hypothetical protein [Lipingzhangella halophila]